MDLDVSPADGVRDCFLSEITVKKKEEEFRRLRAWSWHRIASSISYGSTRKRQDLIHPLLCFTCRPNRDQPFHCNIQWHPSRNNDDARADPCRDEFGEVSGHGATVVGDKDATFL